MKKTILVAIVGLALVLGFGYSVNQYQKSHKPVPMVPQSQYAQLSHQMAVHDAVSLHQIEGLQAQVTSLTAQRNAVCTQAKTAKLLVAATNCQ